MYRPSETANDLFRRLSSSFFDVRVSGENYERVQFGDKVEVQAARGDVTEVRTFSFLKIMYYFITPLLRSLF
jgi:hypothetical protein